MSAVRYLWGHLFIHIVTVNVKDDAKRFAMDHSFEVIGKNEPDNNGSGGIYLVISALAKGGEA